jgi:hypothetical protein
LANASNAKFIPSDSADVVPPLMALLPSVLDDPLTIEPHPPSWLEVDADGTRDA